MRTAVTRVAAGLAVAFALSACAAGPPQPPDRPAVDPRIAAALEALAHLDPHIAVVQVPGERAGALDGSLLNGLSGAEVELVLGPPGRVRIDPPAQVWQYDQPRCFVDVFLYTDDGDTRVVYVQERSREVKKVPPGQCVGGVWQARQVVR